MSPPNDVCKTKFTPMKFLTRSWIRGELTDEQFDYAISTYEQHLQMLQLPPDLVALADLHVHDGLVLSCASDSAAKSLQLRLRCGDLHIGYFDAVLTFTRVTITAEDVRLLSAVVQAVPVEILTQEIDRLNDDHFECRWLLHPAGEAAIQFSSVTLDRRAVPNRDAP